MPITRPSISPGIYRETTRTSAEGHWFDADKVRFRWGQPEKIGGWQKTLSPTLSGVPRKIKTWRGNDANIYSAIGTSSKLYVIFGGVAYNITPFRKSSNLNNAWSTVNTFSTVTVFDPGHGVTAGDTTNYPAAVTVGGITLLGDYTVVTVVDANNYTISATVASSTVNLGGGGPFVVNYEISPGPVDSTFSAGWGADVWGTGTWGTARTGLIIQPARCWSLDLWGDILVGCPFGGNIYKWDPTGDGLAVRATVIPNAPTQVNYILVNPDTRFLIALGCNNLSSGYDPLTVAWSDQEDYTTWTPAITNAAGQLRITGKGIVTAVRSAGGIVIFTESEVHSLDYIAGDLIFGSRMLGDNAGTLSQNGAIEFDGTVYWMGHHNFYYYDGSIHVLPSPVRSFVYNDLNFTQADKIVVGINPVFREVWFFYPSADQTGLDNDRYVFYSPVEQSWSIGALARTAWEGHEFGELPIAGDPTGQIWTHEVGVDADGQAMPAFISTTSFDIGDGDQVMYVDKYIPDFDMTGTATVSVSTQYYPSGATITKGPYMFTDATTKVDLRARGRYVSWEFTSSNVGDSWTLASLRFNAQPDGRH